MSPDWIIGALAFITIGGVLGLSVLHFGVYLKSPANREAAKRVAEDRESATTGFSSEGASRRSLRQRLDAAPGIDDRLSARPVGANPLIAFFDTDWSRIRQTLRG